MPLETWSKGLEFPTLSERPFLVNNLNNQPEQALEAMVSVITTVVATSMFFMYKLRRGLP